MSTKGKFGFIALGFVIWAAGTLIYRIIGSSFFEVNATWYWLNLILTSLLCAVVSLGIMKWGKIEQKDWLQGAICMALPGMFSEIPILVGFSELMSNMQPATAGRYAAFLFACYSIVIGAAWFMSAKASSPPISETRLVGTKR